MKKIFLPAVLSCLMLTSYANNKVSYADYFAETYADVDTGLPWNSVSGVGASALNEIMYLAFSTNVASYLEVQLLCYSAHGPYTKKIWVEPGTGGVSSPVSTGVRWSHNGGNGNASGIDVISICPSSDNVYQYVFWDGTLATCDPGDGGII